MSFDPDSERNDGARSLGESGDAASPSTAVTEFMEAAAEARRSAFKLQHGAWAAGLLLVLGAGVFGLQSIRSVTVASADVEKKVDPAQTAQLIGRLQDEIGRLKGSLDTLRTTEASKQEDTIRGLKKSVENLRQEIEQTRSSYGATLAQLSTKIDKTDHDPSQKLAEIMARLDKLDREPKDKSSEAASQKLSDVAARLERIERQVSSPSPAAYIPVAPQHLAATPPPRSSSASAVPISVEAPKPPVKPAAKPETSVVAAVDPKALPAKQPTLDGWVLRDVYDGMALVEAREGGLREIAPGEFLPGAGEIRSIERRGRSWVVLTSRGVIQNSVW